VCVTVSQPRHAYTFAFCENSAGNERNGRYSQKNVAPVHNELPTLSSQPAGCTRIRTCALASSAHDRVSQHELGVLHETTM
jgi:ABC-type dipeptide/oligopeptide/nickel transport system ATPase component